MPASLASFKTSLTESGLISANELGDVIESLSGDDSRDDPGCLARELVRRGMLTEFQANALYQGRSKGLVFGEYVVHDKLGAGGMGRVFKAVHRRMDRVVAIKVLPKESLSSSDAVERFHREVRAAAKLHHVNIVAAYDAGDRDGIHYLVMEYVDGIDLGRLVKEQGPLKCEEAIDCIMQAAEGLKYAHCKGVIHRDIKPTNLLLGSDGTLKILDMGLARLDALGSQRENDTVAEDITRAGQVIGTLDYMAPEQAEDITRADQRADIYSLGCTLFRLVTGKVPFPGDTALRRIIAHRESPIPSISGKRSDAPPALDAILRRMLAKDPADRFASMEELIEQLKPLRDHALPAFDLPTKNRVSDQNDISQFLRGLEGENSRADNNATAGVAAGLQSIAVAGDTQFRPKLSRRGRRLAMRTWLLLAIATALLVPFALALTTWTRSAQFEVHWPPLERRGAQLLIDGEQQPVPLTGSLSFKLRPGRHRVVLLRQGYEPIQWMLDLERGTLDSRTPLWRRMEKPAD